MSKTQEVQRYAVEITSAISVVHSVGVIHGDIKPSNVFLTKEGKCKLSLFSSFYLINILLLFIMFFTNMLKATSGFLELYLKIW
jgi:serine/threonine protein kinase